YGSPSGKLFRKQRGPTVSSASIQSSSGAGRSCHIRTKGLYWMRRFRFRITFRQKSTSSRGYSGRSAQPPREKNTSRPELKQAPETAIQLRYQFAPPKWLQT